jgi:carboxyl-terminal processing protease
VVKIANLFVGEGVIVSTRSDRVPSENKTYYASRSRLAVEAGVPIAVLTDRGSASASEILAGVLKDTQRGTLVGEKSYGKGSVQQIMPLGNWGAGMRLTMSRYFTPSNVSIDKVGIEPAIKVEEPKLSPKEEADLTELLTTNALRDFVKATPSPTDEQVGSFIAALRGKGIQLNDRYLRRMVRNEVNRTNNDPPVFDLDYDLALQAALEAIQSGRIKGK